MQLPGALVWLDRQTPAEPVDGGKLISPPMELVRLAIPRRVYTQSHIDYVIEVILDVFSHRTDLRGLRITEEAPVLRHFTAKFERLNEQSSTT